MPEMDATGRVRLGEEVDYLLEQHRLTIACVSAITVVGECSCRDFCRRVRNHTSTESLSIIYREFAQHLTILGYRK